MVVIDEAERFAVGLVYPTVVLASAIRFGLACSLITSLASTLALTSFSERAVRCGRTATTP